MKKLAIANLGISFAMFSMLIFAEVIGAKHLFGVIIGIYWRLLDMAVLIVSAVTGVFLCKSSRER